MNILKTIIAISALLLATNVLAGEKVWWTVDVSKVFVKNGGHMGLIVKSGSATGPNPTNSTWDESCGNTLYFMRTESGTTTPEYLQQELVKLATTARVGGYKAAVAVYKLSGDTKCYTSQVQI